MATGVKTQPKTIKTSISTSASEERPITQIVTEAVQFTQTYLDTLHNSKPASALPAVVQERRWPLAIGLSAAAAASLTLWCGIIALVVH